MKRHVQLPGIRKWSGDDLLELQGESLKVLDDFFSRKGNCVICGCEVTDKNISAGLVTIDNIVMPFKGGSTEVFPVYLVSTCTDVTREYLDNIVRDIAKQYEAGLSTQKPSVGYIEIKPDSVPTFFDANDLVQDADYIHTDNNYTAAEKKKLKDIEEKANNYSLPQATAAVPGGVKVGYTASGKNYAVILDANGQAYVSVPWTDTNTTYEVATQSVNGLMSAVDKKKLDGVATGANNYTLPQATAAVPGGVKIGYTASGKNYAVVLDAGGQAYVSVPWTDTNTTYEVATQSVNGLMSAVDKKKLDGVATGANNYTLPQAAAAVLGGVKIGYVASGKNYAVVLDAGGQAYVNVPWTDTNTVYTHPAFTAYGAGLYKITTNNQGHVTTATAVTKADITGLGIPAQDTSYSVATQSANGLMSAADKKRIDNAIVPNNVTTATTLTGLSVANYSIKVTLSAASALSFASTPVEGWECVIDIKNTLSSNITQAIPSGAAWQCDDTSVTLVAGKITSISVRYIHGVYMVRV